MKDPQLAALEQARREADTSRARLVSTATVLQARLKPASLASNAWEGVREKSSEIGQDAIQTVKDRPVVASGIFAAAVLFFARHPIMAAAKSLFAKDEEEEGLVTTHLAGSGADYDIAAPRVSPTIHEGANA